ncbi:MAG: LytTR family DNA-binding domain-containing protein [Hyphomicrobiales bacterium]
MWENLNEHYPFNNNFKHNIKTIAIVVVCFILIVLYLQPFGINFFRASFYGYFVLAAGFISSIVLFLHNVVLPEILPKLFDKNFWTLKKQLIYNLWITIVLLVLFGVFAQITNYFDFPYLPVFRTALLSIVPIVFLNIINYNIAIKKKFSKAVEEGLHWIHEDKKKKESKINAKDLICIWAENKKDKFECDISSLAAIGSASNYVEVYWFDGKQINKELVRTTLSSVMKSISSFDNIKQCHRSWLVNVSFVKEMKRQNHNFILILEKLDFFVPVSRTYTPLFRSMFFYE